MKLLRRALPLEVRIRLWNSAELVWAKLGRWRVECPVCGWRFHRFRPYGLVRRENARCPRCGALERHRLHWLYLREKDLLRPGIRLLHFAPEPCFVPHLRRRIGPRYVATDLMAGRNVRVRSDITRLPFPDRAFDAILCSHVLEHVHDDRGAMTELFRVLRSGGWALIDVPLDESRDTTFEDPTVTDPVERERSFGQRDHVRVYGRDFTSRLAGAGFEITVETYGHGIDRDRLARHALRPRAIHLCVRS